MNNLDVIKEAVVSGSFNDISRLVYESLESGLNPQEIINDGLIEGMLKVGDLWKSEEIFLAEVIVSARTLQAALNILRPMLTKEQSKTRGTVILGSVKGDVHDIGKNLVGLMLEGAGFNVLDIGVDRSSSDFVKKAQDCSADVVALSSLLSTTMKEIPIVIEALKKAGLRERLKVVIGGAPVTEEFANKVGADGYAPDAISAVEKLKNLLNT